jgi:hypothetical protein
MIKIPPSRTVHLLMALVSGALGYGGCGNVSETNALEEECEAAKAHVAECELESYSVDCTYLTGVVACMWRCDASAPCSALQGVHSEAGIEWLNCKARCSCQEHVQFLSECGGDASGVDCARAQSACSCSYIRSCDAAENWKQCVLDKETQCFGN